jgi:LAO/AO transport system kinase
MTIDGLLAAFRSGAVPALARAISLVENGREGYQDLLSALHPAVGRAHRVGVTGPPGAGKSTLTERMIHAYRATGLRVAVVAVDPTSPFSGGALLGDRIRMESVTLDPDVYIRSMATRGELGGLATTTREVCDVLDAFGFDRIVVETVGVGQSELTIAAAADTALLVLVPESGDGIQVLKAGVMEVADIYAINKADRPGADRLRTEIEVMLGIRRGNAFRHVAPHHLSAPGRPASGTRDGSGESWGAGPTDRRTAGGGEDTGWEPPALTVSALNDVGVGEVVDAIERHAVHLRESGELERRRRARLARHTREVVDRSLRRFVWEDGLGEAGLQAGLDRISRGELTPYQLADEILAGVKKEMAHGHA